MRLVHHISQMFARVKLCCNVQSFRTEMFKTCSLSKGCEKCIHCIVCTRATCIFVTDLNFLRVVSHNEQLLVVLMVVLNLLFIYTLSSIQTFVIT